MRSDTAALPVAIVGGGMLLGWLSVVAYVNIFPPLDPPLSFIEIPRSVLVYDLGNPPVGVLVAIDRDEQRWSVDVLERLGCIIGLERSRYRKLARPLHVDVRNRVQRADSAVDIGRPRQPSR